MCLRATARVEQFEVILRIDFDDKETLSRMDEFACYGNVRAVIGNRGVGYNDLNLLYDDAAEAARGDWVWMLNDDCEISGVGWADKLERLPKKGVIVQAEWYKLGGSMYREHVDGAFPMVPRDSWKLLGAPMIPFVVDYGLNVLCKQHGWKTHFIRNLTTNHKRDKDELLQAHRALTPSTSASAQHPFRRIKP